MCGRPIQRNLADNIESRVVIALLTDRAGFCGGRCLEAQARLLLLDQAVMNV